MATSIKINGRDVRAAYGLEILSGLPYGMAQLAGQDSKIAGREGAVAGNYNLDARTIRLSGEVLATSHAALLTQLDALKAAMGAEYNGARPFRLELADITDRYFLCRLKSFDASPIGQSFICTSTKVDIEIILDNPFGIYNTKSLYNITGSPFTSPISLGINHLGTGLTRPRILLENVGANNISSLTLINTACKNTQRLIAPSAVKPMTRVTGRWGDAKGAALFTAASSSGLAYLCQGNFNPGCFSVYMDIYAQASTTGSVGYLFSTTGDIIKIYDKSFGQFAFSVNGTELQANVVGTFIDGQWWRMFASYDGVGMKFYIKRLGYPTTYGTSGLGPGTPYTGLPTSFFIGTDASSDNVGTKRIDELRLFNYPLNTDVGDELDALNDSLGPLPIGRGCTFYQSFDDSDSAIGMDNSILVITETVAQNSMLDINCETFQVNKLTAAFDTAPDNVIDNVAGEFPFLVPGYNGIQLIHNGSASGLNIAIEDKRRFL